MTTTTGIGVHDQNLERQIEKHMGGCMAGFFNLFDRNHLLAGKRLYPKRLPPPLPSSVVPESSPEPASLPANSSPKSDLRSPEIGDPPRSPLAVSTFEFKEAVKSPWKFSREAPRLSLDSRAVVDAKGGLRINTTSAANAAVSSAGDDNQRRSPSVIARLMGLELPPTTTNSSSSSVSEPSEKKVELRRSASESRSRDYRFFDAPNFLSPLAAGKSENISSERKSDQNISRNTNYSTNVANNVVNSKTKNQSNQRRVVVERRSHYDAADFFPPEKHNHHHNNHQATTIYGEIERRLRMKGIDEPSKDLETLKHILEALQLKGLLHHSSPSSKPRQNFIGEEESPIVVMKPARGPRRNVEQSVSPRRARSPGVRRKGGPLSIETQRRVNETTITTTPRSGNSPGQSPRRTRRGPGDQTVSRSPRGRRSTVESVQEDETSTVSESSFTTSSHTDNEQYREGRNLLERCDKLLHSIAEMNSNSSPNSAELQKPSPVSVLDPSFYKEDESSPSPVKKRSIDFKDQVPVMELEDEQWSPSSSSSSKHLPDHQDHHHHQEIDSTSDGSDFSYVSEVLRASMYLPNEPDLFQLLEKKHGLVRGHTKACVLQRRLIFDTVAEIMGRAHKLPPWKSARPTLGQVWAELTRIQERGPSEDLLEAICGVLKKDLAINGWDECHVEVSEAVLDIERLIFKDLITETIRDVAAFRSGALPRRKLVF